MKLQSDEIFSCKQCGDCCIGFGGTEINSQDIEKIANFLKITSEEFLKKYCTKKSNNEIVIKQGEDNKCIFFKKNCSIHKVKPTMCKDWPFISNLLKEPSNWEIMASVCPGMKKNVPYETIIETVKNEKLKVKS